jgi:hypothetical protein
MSDDVRQIDKLNLVARSGAEPLEQKVLEACTRDLFALMAAHLREAKLPVVVVLVTASGQRRAMGATLPPDMAAVVLAETIQELASSSVEAADTALASLKPTH